ncbi:MAG: dipeptide epimerase [Eubacteriaceae bacterium]|nr:dipeptide epimerase [Eubacteriaceae bacterium]
MKISSIELASYQVKLKKPFITSVRRVDWLEGLVVKVELADGTFGIGESAPTALVTGDTKGGIVAAIDEAIRPAIVGMDFDCFEEVTTRLSNCILHNTSAKSAVDIALYDIFAKRCSMPLYKLLGGSSNQIETDITISATPLEQTLQDCREAIGEGYTILKVKTGKDKAADAARVAAIRKEVGAGIKILVDANQGYSPKEAVSIINKMQELNADVYLLEQPVNSKDFEGLKYVSENSYVPILADEAVFSLRDAIRLITGRIADMANIKLDKCGGIAQAVKLRDLFGEYGIDCMVGCMLEGAASVGAAAHFAAATRVVTLADLDGPLLCESNPFDGGAAFSGPIIRLGNAPGTGIKGFPKGSLIISY